MTIFDNQGRDMEKHERLIRPIRQILLPLLILLAFASCIRLARFAFSIVVHTPSGQSSKPPGIRLDPR